MKKYNLWKVLGIAFLAFFVISWIIPTGAYSNGEFTSGSTAPLGIFDLVRVPINTIGNFLQVGIVFLLIGGLYGVMNATGVYTKFVQAVTKKFEKKKKMFLIITTVFFAVLSSLTGLSITLFVMVPLFVTLLLSMNYRKKTAILATIGGILVGTMGSTYGFNVAGYIHYFFQISIHHEIFTKIVFFVIVTFLLVMFVLRSGDKDLRKFEKIVDKKEKENKKEKHKDHKEKDKEKENVLEKREDIPLYEINIDKKKSFVPMIVLFAIAMVLLLVGMYNWKAAFDITLFEDVYTKLMDIQINGYPIIKNIFGAINPIGYWNYIEMSSVLIILTLLLGWLYNVKFKDMFEHFIKGAKEMLPTALLVTLASVIMFIMISSQTGSNIYNTILHFFLSMTKGMNIFTTAIASGIGSLFFNDFPYLLNSVYGNYMALYDDVAIYSLAGLIFQSIYGIVMFIVPTSMILIGGLSLFHVSYKDWAKYIWKFLVEIFVVTIIISLILFLFL